MEELHVKVKPGEKQESITEKDGFLVISVREKPENNRANSRVIELIAERFGVEPAKVKIVSGGNKRTKRVVVLQ